jgi:hypothetical protein
MQLTQHNYETIISRIVNRRVTPPTDKDCYQLNNWLQGYAQCQNDIIDIITLLKETAQNG